MNAITETFDAVSAAIQHAKKKAQFGHKDWLAWRISDGRACASPLSLESVETAIAEVSGDYFFLIHKEGGITNVGRGMANIILKNKQHGM
jgi:hypothetical protein